MQSKFRGVFLTCDDAEVTADFYRDVAGVPLEAVSSDEYTYWMLDIDGVQIALHDAKAFADYSYPPNPSSNLTHLYFRIPDLEAFLDHVQSVGAPLIEVDDVVVTLEDPDGRKVMFGTA
ncbi:MAG: VOC family protein [Brevibacterium sp.]|uniref:VOC family protein n=1 Tax=Brevibacterium aurantiacum TaxID=273384 RepID=UPI0018669ADB|nr:VOC family protein [Brevibacterium aurantiacum]